MKFRVVDTEYEALLDIEKLTKTFFWKDKWEVYDTIYAARILPCSEPSKYLEVRKAIEERNMKYLLPIIKKYIERKEKGFEPEVLVEFEVQV